MPLCVIFYISDFLEATVELDLEAPPDDAPTSRPRSSSLGSSSSSSGGGRRYSHPRRRHRRDLSTSTSSSTSPLPERRRRGGGPPSKPSQACRARTPQVSSRAWPCSALRSLASWTTMVTSTAARGPSPPSTAARGPSTSAGGPSTAVTVSLLLYHQLCSELHLWQKKSKIVPKKFKLFLLNFSCHFVFLLPLLFLLLGLSSLPCMAR